MLSNSRSIRFEGLQQERAVGRSTDCSRTRDRSAQGGSRQQGNGTVVGACSALRTRYRLRGVGAECFHMIYNKDIQYNGHG